MFATVIKIVLLLLALWSIYALLTGRAPWRVVTDTVKQSARASKSRAMLIAWWILVAGGALWLVAMAIYH